MRGTVCDGRRDQRGGTHIADWHPAIIQLRRRRHLLGKALFFTAHPPGRLAKIVPHNSLSDRTKKPGSPQRFGHSHLSTLALQLQSLNPWK